MKLDFVTLRLTRRTGTCYPPCGRRRAAPNRADLALSAAGPPPVGGGFGSRSGRLADRPRMGPAAASGPQAWRTPRKAPRAIEQGKDHPRENSCRSARGAHGSWRRRPGGGRGALPQPRGDERPRAAPAARSCFLRSPSGPCRGGRRALRAAALPAPACGSSDATALRAAGGETTGSTAQPGARSAARRARDERREACSAKNESPAVSRRASRLWVGWLTDYARRRLISMPRPSRPMMATEDAGTARDISDFALAMK